MSAHKQTINPRLTIVLGAGATRGVSYAHLGKVPSPLDRDFFDLLQRLQPNDSDQQAVEYVLHQASRVGDFELRGSMERMFYTLHLRAYPSDHKRPSPSSPSCAPEYPRPPSDELPSDAIQQLREAPIGFDCHCS